MNRTGQPAVAGKNAERLYEKQAIAYESSALEATLAARARDLDRRAAALDHDAAEIEKEHAVVNRENSVIKRAVGVAMQALEECREEVREMVGEGIALSDEDLDHVAAGGRALAAVEEAEEALSAIRKVVGGEVGDVMSVDF